MNKYKKLVSNTAILGIGTFASKVLVFFLMPLYTRCLTKAEYSTADLIMQTSNLLIPLISLGICEAVFRFTLGSKAEKYDRREVFSSGFVTLLFGGAVFLLVTPALLFVPYFKGDTYLIFCYVIASIFHSLCAQFVRAEGDTALFAVQGILATVVTIGLNVLFLVVFDMKVTGYVLSVILADVVSTVFLFVYAKLWKNISFKAVKKDILKSMLKYSIPLIPTTVFWWVTNVADRYMVEHIKGADMNGLYAVSYKIPTLLILLSGIFIEAWQFSAVTERGDGENEHRRFFGNIFDSFQAITFIAGAFLIAFAKVCTVILVSDGFYDSWQFIPTLSVATIFSSLVTFMGSVYLVEKKSVLSFVTSMIGAVINVALNLLLIPVWGAHGAAIATFVCYFVVFIIRAINARRYIKFNMHPVKLSLNTAIVAAMCFAMVFETGGWIIVQCAGILAIVALNAKAIYSGIAKIFEGKLKKGKKD